MAQSQTGHPLVSMITYCFNGERFIRTYFDALLTQTYTELELFFYNNGSVDATGAIAEEYRPRLEEKFRAVHIEHYAENQPTVSLKNKALSRLSGKYFFGVDSDDIMTPDHVEKMVSYLEEHPSIDLVFCKLHILNENTGKHTGIMEVKPRKTAKEHFLDCLFSRNMIYTPIAYMIRTEGFLRANHQPEIYVTRYGENYQLLLPLLYYKKPGLIDEPLGEYLVRGDSYTAKLHDYNKKITALEEQIITITKTLEQMQIPDEEKFRKRAEKRLRLDCLHTAIDSGDRTKMREQFRKSRKSGVFSPKAHVKYLLFCLRGEK
ncbi:MAG: glycosyltransferase family A protein [Faecousia sp.]